MDITALLLKHANRRFTIDSEDEYGAFMLVDEFKVHVRREDVQLAEGLSMAELHPLIDNVIKISNTS